MSESERSGRGALKIGAIARLTGVSVHTLRKWEERYGAVEPQRTEGGERVYTQSDLERLTLIKRLAGAGLSLREIARLPLEALAAAWEDVATSTRGRPRRRVRLAILGSALAAMLGRRAAPSGLLEVVASAQTSNALEEALDGAPVDLLVYECPTVRRETHQRVRGLLERLGARAAVVVYGFAARGDLLALQAPDLATLRAPADAQALEQAASALIHPGATPEPDRRAAGSDADVPPPRLSREAIARVLQSAPRMRCECPHHLADLILSLRAFEDYSAECESRNSEDALLHHYLWRSAAQARALFEDAIERVAEAEGIRLAE